MPLYRACRRRLGCRRQALAVVMVTSGALHVVVYGALGFTEIALFQLVGFGTLTAAVWSRREKCLHCVKTSLLTKEECL